VKKLNYGHLVLMIVGFQKQVPRGSAFLEKYYRVGINELYFELQKVSYGNWWFYKNMAHVFESNYDALMRIPKADMLKIATQVLSASRKFFNQANPKTPVSPHFLLDTGESCDRN